MKFREKNHFGHPRNQNPAKFSFTHVCKTCLSNSHTSVTKIQMSVYKPTPGILSQKFKCLSKNQPPGFYLKIEFTLQQNALDSFFPSLPLNTSRHFFYQIPCRIPVSA